MDESSQAVATITAEEGTVAEQQGQKRESDETAEQGRKVCK